MSDIEPDYLEVQVGGGGCAAPPSPVLTPTRLRTSIKATNRDRGLISKAQIRCTLLIPPTAKEKPGPSANDDPFVSSPEICCASKLFPSMEKTLFLEHLKSTSPAGSGMMGCLYSPLFFLIAHPRLDSDGTPMPKGKFGTHEQSAKHTPFNTVGAEASFSDLAPSGS